MNPTRLFERYAGPLCLTILLLCISGFAQAQTRVTACDPATPNNALCVTGTHDGKAVDGSTVVGVTFRVEQKFGSGAFATAATALPTLQYYARNLAPGTYTFRVFANCSLPQCTESLASNALSKDATAIPVQPNAPVIIIAATIRAGQPPVYRIVYTVRPRDGEIVFLAPESMRSVFAAR